MTAFLQNGTSISQICQDKDCLKHSKNSGLVVNGSYLQPSDGPKRKLPCRIRTHVSAIDTCVFVAVFVCMVVPMRTTDVQLVDQNVKSLNLLLLTTMQAW